MVTELVKREAIAEEAKSWIGVRYRHLGRSRDGIDCVGLIVLVAKPFDVLAYTDNVAYSRTSRGRDLVEPFKEYMDRILLRDIGDGDVVLFRSGPFPHHCGVIWVDKADGRKYLIHAEAGARVVSITGLDSMIDKAIMAFRFRGTE